MCQGLNILHWTKERKDIGYEDHPVTDEMTIIYTQIRVNMAKCVKMNVCQRSKLLTVN